MFTTIRDVQTVGIERVNVVHGHVVHILAADGGDSGNRGLEASAIGSTSASRKDVAQALRLVSIREADALRVDVDGLPRNHQFVHVSAVVLLEPAVTVRERLLSRGAAEVDGAHNPEAGEHALDGL